MDAKAEITAAERFRIGFFHKRSLGWSGRYVAGADSNKVQAYSDRLWEKGSGGLCFVMSTFFMPCGYIDERNYSLSM